MKRVIVTGSFDDLRCGQVRLLEEAARLGPLEVLLWSDAVIQEAEGRGPKFPEEERRYLLESIRYVDRVTSCHGPIDRDALAQVPTEPAIWAVSAEVDSPAKRAFCRDRGLEYCVFRPDELRGFPECPVCGEPTTRKRVIVTGCYDWFHSGHVRFFEEVSQLGDVYAIVGHDANIKLLKGAGHPLFPEQERKYMVQSIRFVKQALVSTGQGWLDAEPEIQRIEPHIYAVNEDGDRPEKSRYCRSHGIEYRVLKRTPKEGLPRRDSTSLRGF